MSNEYRLAVDDEEYPIGFDDALLNFPDEEEDDYREEEDFYDFPEDTKDGLFDPMEAE
jgi:hypothetical protein